MYVWCHVIGRWVREKKNNSRHNINNKSKFIITDGCTGQGHIKGEITFWATRHTRTKKILGVTQNNMEMYLIILFYFEIFFSLTFELLIPFAFLCSCLDRYFGS